MSKSHQESGKLGPITRKIIRSIWTILFQNDPKNSYYLPRIVREGKPEIKLPPYDPARFEAEVEPVNIPNVPLDVIDSACIDPTSPIPPVSSSVPGLVMKNFMVTHFSNMAPADLTFSETDPQFNAVIRVGGGGTPLTMTPIKAGNPSFHFQVGCCVPKSEYTRECSSKCWKSDAQGTFQASAADVEITLTIRVNMPSEGPLTVSILEIAVKIDPKNIRLDFDVENLPKWAKQMAKIAIREGVQNGSVTKAFQQFLNQSSVRVDMLEKVVNTLLAQLP